MFSLSPLASGGRMRRRRLLILSVASCVLFSATALALAQGTKPRGAASPQDVVAVIMKSSAANDLPAMLPVIAPDGLRELASDGVTSILMALRLFDPDAPMAGTAKPSASELAAQRKRYKEALDLGRRTLQPHGLDTLIGKPPLAPETQKAVDASLAKTDNVVLVAALFEAAQQLPPILGMKDGFSPPPPVTLDNVTAYRITGDTATAQDGAERLNFVRIRGRWYISPPSKTGAPPASSSAAQEPAPRATASGSQPEIVVGGMQVVKVVVPADDYGAKPFNADNGTRLVLWIKMPAGQGLIEVDDDGSTLQHFGDDKGTDLGGRFGSFPSEFKDGSGGTLTIESTGMPAASATALVGEGTVALTVATGTRKTRVAKVQLQNDHKFTFIKTPVTVSDVTADSDSLSFKLQLPRQVMVSIKGIAFFDASGKPLESSRTFTGYMNDAAEVGFTVKTTVRTITMEFEAWQNVRTVKVPFKVRAGLGLGSR
jgi:hypothetical protein